MVVFVVVVVVCIFVCVCVLQVQVRKVYSIYDTHRGVNISYRRGRGRGGGADNFHAYDLQMYHMLFSFIRFM